VAGSVKANENGRSVVQVELKDQTSSKINGEFGICKEVDEERLKLKCTTSKGCCMTLILTASTGGQRLILVVQQEDELQSTSQ
jgi:hypothetical protein